MEVSVKVFGTFRERFPDYRPSEGIRAEVPDGATVRDLLACLGLLEIRGAAVIAEGRVLRTDERVRPGVPVSVMQAVDGG